MSSCPKCRNALVMTSSNGVPLAVCSTCQGVWLSASALVHQTSADIWQALMQQEAAPIIEASPYRATPAQEVTCLSCGQPMQTVTVGPVSVERCKQCQGVFLDRGELVLLISHFGPATRWARNKRVDDLREVLLPLLFDSHWSRYW